MRYAVAKDETDILELTARIFKIKGRGATAASRQAEQALRQANPHLRDLTKIKPGTLIVIPEIPDLPKLRGSQVVDPRNDSLTQAQLALEEFSEVTTKMVKGEEENIAAQLQALKDSDLRKFLVEAPEAKELLATLNESLKRRSKEIRPDAAAQKEGVKQLQDAIEKMPIG